LNTGMTTVTSGFAPGTGAFYHPSLTMVGMRRIERLAPVAYGVLAVATTALALIPVLRPADWSLTALPRVATSTLMGQAARAHDPGFHTVDTGAYDGQFYWGIAVDPLARGDVHQAFDKASYRYGHPLLGWLGWLLSAGQARAAPAALLVVGLASMFAAALLAALLGRSRGSTGWEGLFIALNPGLIYAAAHDLAEPLSAALLMGGLLAYRRERRLVAWACLGLLVLSKEQFVLVPLAIGAWELLRGRRKPIDLAPFAACLLPAAGWWLYSRLQLGAWFTTGGSAITTPFSGWKRALLDAGAQTYSTDASQNVSAEATLVILVVLLALLAFTGLKGLRLRSPGDGIYLLLGLVVVCLAPNATVLLRDALRNTAVLLALVPFVIVFLPPRPTSSAHLAEGNSTGPPPSPT
jgi:hypothetical protein